MLMLYLFSISTANSMTVIESRILEDQSGSSSPTVENAISSMELIIKSFMAPDDYIVAGYKSSLKKERKKLETAFEQYPGTLMVFLYSKNDLEKCVDSLRWLVQKHKVLNQNHRQPQ